MSSVVGGYAREDATKVIRAAVSELEEEWAEQLGARRFGQLRSLLVELNQLV